MLKSILTQIWNRRQNNSWIIIELILVFCLIWYMTDYFFVLTYNYSIPNYRNIDHTFMISINEYQSDNPEYIEEENEPETKEANINHILQTIRNYPGVESLSVSFFNSTPESSGYSEISFQRPDDTIQISAQDCYIDKNYDYFKVFGYTTNNGKKPASMQDFDWSQPNGIIVSRSIEQALFPNENSCIGKELQMHQGKLHKIIGVVDNTKRFDYQRPRNIVFSMFSAESFTSQNITISEIAIRSNSALSDAIFKENLEKELGTKLPVGNFYLQNITSFNEKAHSMKVAYGMETEIQLRIYLMLFFLVNIILCVVGTFWYRVNTRKDEIGLRKALGSSSTSIRNCLLTEGLCLLTIAALFAMIIEFQFVHAGLIETLGIKGFSVRTTLLPDRTFLRFLITNGITWIIIAVVTIAAIWLPARKAAAMEAATALHYE